MEYNERTTKSKDLVSKLARTISLGSLGLISLRAMPGIYEQLANNPNWDTALTAAMGSGLSVLIGYSMVGD